MKYKNSDPNADSSYALVDTDACTGLIINYLVCIVKCPMAKSQYITSKWN